MAWDDTFNVNPEFVFASANNYGVLQTQADSGLVQRRAVYTDVLRVFTLQWENATKAMKDAILQFFKDTLGGCLPLKWVPPNEVNWIRVKFVEDSLKWTRKTGVQYSLSFQFKELFKGNLY